MLNSICSTLRFILLIYLTGFTATLLNAETISFDDVFVSSASENLIEPNVRYERAIRVNLTNISVNGELERYNSEFDIIFSQDGSISKIVIYANNSEDVNATINSFNSNIKAIKINKNNWYFEADSSAVYRLAQRNSDNLILSGICSLLQDFGGQISNAGKLNNIKKLSLKKCPFGVSTPDRIKIKLEGKFVSQAEQEKSKQASIAAEPEKVLITAIQQYLFHLGFKVGKTDGVLRNSTLKALDSAYKLSGQHFNGEISETTLDYLRSINLNPQATNPRCSSNNTIKKYKFTNNYKTKQDIQILPYRYSIKGYGNWSNFIGEKTPPFFDMTNDTKKTNSTVSAFALNYNFMSPENPNFRYFRNFTTDRFNHDFSYGDAYKLNFLAPGFLETYMATLATIQKKRKYDGIFLDYWSESNQSTNRNASKNFRLNLFKSIRKTFGENYIIIGNVNLNGDVSTHKYLNGAYIETSADHPQGYTCHEIAEIEKLILLHNKKLAEPRIVILDVSSLWYGYKNENNFLSEDNVRFARLFSALVTVLADNGVISYSSYEPTGGRRIGYRYKFQNLNIENPKSQAIKIANGIHAKFFDKGLIAYNTNQHSAHINIEGQEFTIPALDAVFCKTDGDRLICE